MRLAQSAFLLMLAAVAACSPSAPDPAEGPSPRAGLTMLEAPPVYSLLGYRDRLELTSPQIAALDSIARSVQEQNRPMREQLREMTARGRPRSGRPVITDEMRPLVDEIGENNKAAMAAVREVLTPEQQTTACRLADNPSGRAQPERSARSAERRRSLPADSIGGGAGGRVWSWCSPAATAPSE